MTDSILKDVSDTALWVAVYRARETAKPDALFRDPMAGKLAGERGLHIETKMSDSRYVEWSVIIRTCIIDRYIEKLISEEGIDTVINLGAGLDSRPYRMRLPERLRWIEVDFPNIIKLKEERLSGEKTVCRLERISQDLSIINERRTLFARLNSEATKAIVITEGVTPYLSNDAVASLAKDLHQQPRFQYWINDYNSPDLTKRLTSARRKKEMKNAPFLFDPSDWTAFYEQLGWRKRDLQYIGEEGGKLGRPAPHPWLGKLIFKYLLPAAASAKINRMNGYALLERTP